MHFIKFRSKSSSSLETQNSSSSEMEKASLSSISEPQESPVSSKKTPVIVKVVAILAPDDLDINSTKKGSRFVGSLPIQRPWIRQNHRHTERSPSMAPRSIEQTLAEAGRTGRPRRRIPMIDTSSNVCRTSSAPAKAPCLLYSHPC